MKYLYVVLAVFIFFICPIGASISFLERGKGLLTYVSAFIVISFLWIFGINFIAELLKEHKD